VRLSSYQTGEGAAGRHVIAACLALGGLGGQASWGVAARQRRAQCCPLAFAPWTGYRGGIRGF
jgi:hypothetical protein